MDASAIMQDDTSIENIRAMTEFTREYGVYSGSSYQCESRLNSAPPTVAGMAEQPTPKAKPGACFPWEEKLKEIPEITGDKEIVKRIWENIDALGNMYIWQVLLSF
jgi:hypothetical protein